MANEIYAALEPLGFETMGAACFGTWKGYAIALKPFTARILYVTAAVRLEKVPGGLRRTLNRALRETGKGAGIKISGAELLKKSSITISVSFAKSEDVRAHFTEQMDVFTSVLRENGIAPADTCALSGAARPDSLCLMVMDNMLSYQPVSGAVIRDRDAKTREKVEDNQANGNYALGFAGALLGMLIGLIPTVLGIIFTERIYGVLFALVPLAAMFGYRLFKGKMSRGSIVIVIVLSLLGVLIIPVMEVAFYLVRDYGVPAGDALPYAAQVVLNPEVLPDLGGELLQLLLFMALGIWIAWKRLSGQTNSGQVMSTEAQLASLQPNPVCADVE